MMTDPEAGSSQVAESWDTYWHGTGDVGAYSSGGVSHPAIMAFWDDFFRLARKEYATPKIIDIASGNGAVVERALAVLGNEQADFTCIDVSAAAIENIHSRFPHVRGLVADARSIPLDSGGFDIALSQFGIEYAGLEAVDEAARLVAPGGLLALMLHTQAGSIHRECAASLDAIRRLQESQFIPFSVQLFKTGFAAVRGADRAPYDAAATQLAPALAALEAIMAEHGEHVAGDTIARLYSDVGRIHGSMQKFEAAEVQRWLEQMDGELEAFAGRMASMSAAAIDDSTFEQLCAGLREQGFTIDRAEPLLAPEHDLPLAWVLRARR